MQKSLKNILSKLPASPGVYRFYNAKSEIIYIGKAKILKNRIKSYFNGNTSLNFAKKKMLTEIEDIQFIITQNEREALLLENNLVKAHKPKYNVLLKDDKNFLYIKVCDGPFGKIIKTRIVPNAKEKFSGKYYGPYVSSQTVYHILKLIKKIYGYGVGKHHFFEKSSSYTLDPYIFAGNIDESEESIEKIYHEKIQQIKKFLSGETRDLYKNIYERMQKYAKNLAFEEAQKCKDILGALDDLHNTQIMQTEIHGNYLAVEFLEKYENIYAGVMQISNSKVLSYESYSFEHSEMEDFKEIESKFFEELYIKYMLQEETIYKLLLRNKPQNSNLEINYEIPEIGAKREILKLVYKNIYTFAQKKYINSLASKHFTKKTMQDLLAMTSYTQINTDIVFECNDISHLSGTHTVASRSVIENGRKNPKKYKKYRIKTLSEGKIDDFASMREVISRRLYEIEKTGNIPDCIVIDGGKGQLQAVVETIKSHEFPRDIQLISLAKKEEEIFLPGKNQPIVLQKDSEILRMIQAIRDEAHRFAITFNRDSRNKTMKQSLLDALPGIGPKSRKKIRKHFGHIEKLRSFPKEEIEKQLGKKIYTILENHGLI